MAQVECPVCNSGQKVEWVGTILSRESTTTSGFTLGYNPVMGFTPGVLMANTKPQYLSQFIPPLKPGVPTISKFFKRFIIVDLIGAIITTTLWVHPTFDAGYFTTVFMSLILFIVPAMILTALIFWIEYLQNKTRRTRWRTAYQILWYSRYCSHDDVIYSDDVVGRPNEFINRVFFNVYH